MSPLATTEWYCISMYNGLSHGAWDKQRRYARRRYFSRLFLLCFLPATVGFWLFFYPAISAAILPVQLVALVGAVVGGGFAIWFARRHLPRMASAPLASDVLAAIDRERGASKKGPDVTEFWRLRLEAAIRDKWPGYAVLALTFSIGLNTAAFWLPVASTLFGRPYQAVTLVDRPVVRIDSMRVVSPLDGAITDHSSSDGYIQVHEGAEVSWLVQALVPATHVTLIRDDGETTVANSGDEFYAFQVLAVEPQSYRFRAGRWGVLREERIGRRIEVLPDLPPEPFWLERPPAETDGSEVLAYAWKADDDRAVTAVVLELAGDDDIVRIELFRSDFGVRSTDAFRGRIDPSELPRGDRVTFTLLAYDNDRFGGPNIGRSDPVVVQMRTVEEDHEEWKLSLLSFLRTQTRFLGPVLDKGWAEAPWREFAAERFDGATLLAGTARELADIAGSVKMRSKDAADSLLGIARLYDRVRRNQYGRESDIADVEEAVFRTDELLGNEEAAAIEHKEDRLINRLEQLAEDLTAATVDELDRMFESLLKEMAELAESTKSKRPQLPTELLQRDAFKPEKQSERADLMQQIREALQNGDRERAQELMQQLIEQLKNAQSATKEAAESQRSQSSPSQSELAEQEAALDQLQRRQEEAANRMQEAQQRLNEDAAQLNEEIRRQQAALRQQSAEAQALRQAESALKAGDRDAARAAFEKLGAGMGERMGEQLNRFEQAETAAQKLGQTQRAIESDTAALQKSFREGRHGSAVVNEAMDGARKNMIEAQSALDQKQPGEGANQGWQAAEALNRAKQAVRRQMEQAQQEGQGEGGYAEYQSDRREGENGDDDRGDEAFETPEVETDRRSDRDDVLQGFRRGLPDAGRSVNERYLDRLLH